MVVLSLITSIILARGLGPEGKGIFATIMLYVVAFSLFYRFGTELSIVFYFKKKKYSNEEMLFNLLIVYFILIISGIPIYYLIYFVLKSSWLSSIKISYFILSIFLLSSSIFEIYLQRILLSLKKITQLNINLIVERTLFVVFLTILYINNYISIETALISDILKRILVYIFSGIILSNKIGIKFKINFGFLRDLFHYGLKTYLAGIVDYIITRMDMILIIALLDYRYVGLYSIALLAEKFLLFPQSIGYSWMSEITDQNEKTAQISRVTLFISTVLALPVIIFAKQIIIAVYGKNFELSTLPFQFLMIGVIVFSVSHAIKPYIIKKKKKPIRISQIGVIALVVNSVLNYLFIQNWQIDGAGAATMFSYFTYTLIMVVYYSKKSKVPIKNILFIKKSDFSILRRKVLTFIR